LKQQVDTEDELVDAVYTYSVGQEQGIPYLKEMPKPNLSADGGVTFNIQGVKQHFSPADVNRINQTIGSLLELNVYNASTFACDDLLESFPLATPPKREFHIHYYESPGLPYVKAIDLEERRENLLPKLLTKLKRKVKRDFKTAFQTALKFD
jgi:hypothetical protein